MSTLHSTDTGVSSDAAGKWAVKLFFTLTELPIYESRTTQLVPDGCEGRSDLHQQLRQGDHQQVLDLLLKAASDKGFEVSADDFAAAGLTLHSNASRLSDTELDTVNGAGMELITTISVSREDSAYPQPLPSLVSERKALDRAPFGWCLANARMGLDAETQRHCVTLRLT